ncbi:hypothetical protein [Streptomyces sp. DHE17-7]|uniref:hypothetical protein n=1 Tax=Streptomyces sp. DHE17-7 TaxID=2759949 RepID=UPI000EDD26BE|nr:hypothetical protein [Streptomyces sp. DHE17-7]MBJ6623511.1 hypothetical protein [Streptomyces sp. DHE17-7]RIH58742.1 hypothetical protein D3C59_32885 [Streptomyces sp. SHP22-7]
MTHDAIDWSALPAEVTFTEAARLADSLGIFPGATADKIRHMARARKTTTWPFGDRGEGRPYEYGKVANARKMRTEVFLKHLIEHPPNPQGRGPDKKPRARRADR